VLPDGAIVASRIRDDFAMASSELVHLVAFSIERGNRLLVFVPVLVLMLVRKWPLSFSHCSAHLDPGLSVKVQGRRHSQRNFYFPVVSELG
jgi:hypothetical protein